MIRTALLAALLLLAACAKPAAENTASADNLADPDITEVQDDGAGVGPTPVAQWAGSWDGAGDTALDMAPGTSADTRKLTISISDVATAYVGTIKGSTISFMRDGKPETLHAGTGAETGVADLADNDDCLIVKAGEAYCR